MRGDSVTATRAQWAKQYCERLQWALVPMPGGTKAPQGQGWNQPGGYFTGPSEAAAHWRANPTDNMGVVLGPSGLVTLDIDHAEYSRIIFDEFGVNLDELKTSAPCIVGNPERFRILYRLPAGVELSRKALAWPGQNGEKPCTVFEVRAGLVQDVIPPSVHPDGHSYTWLTPPSIQPVLPPELVALFTQWELFKRDALALCPWAEREPEPQPKKRPAAKPDGPDVIQAWNEAHTIEGMLERYGYKQKGRRWLAPSSTTGVPGVHIKDGRAFSHHGSDPLANGHYCDAFDVYAIMEYGGNASNAYRAAADMLGLKQKPRLTIVHDATASEGSTALQVEPDELPANLRGDLIQTKDGTIKPLLANAAMILRRHDTWAGVLHFDEFATRTVMTAAAPWITEKHETRPWTTADDLKTAEWLQHRGCHVSTDLAQQAVELVANENRVHPVREYLDGLEWDGVERLPFWLSDFCASKNTEYTQAVGTAWMVSAVARVYEPGCQADCVLILEGKQGVGKSSALRILGGEFFTDDMPELTSKDASQAVAGAWIMELAELDALDRSEANAIKAFVTRRVDRYRPPYGKRFIEAPRQSVFCGTVNPDGNGYLRDATGNRRFWPVAVLAIDLDGLASMRGQLWAEAVVRYRRGDSWHLTGAVETLAKAEQAERRTVDEWETLINRYLTHQPGHSEGDWTPRGVEKTELTIAEVLEHAIGLRPSAWNHGHRMRVSRILQDMGMEMSRTPAGRVYKVAGA